MCSLLNLIDSSFRITSHKNAWGKVVTFTNQVMFTDEQHRNFNYLHNIIYLSHLTKNSWQNIYVCY